MKKQKVDITKLSDEELIKYYRTNRNIYKISNIAYPAGSFLVSGLLSNQQAYVFVPAVTAYLALGGVQIFSVCNRITKIKKEIENRDLSRRVKFEDLKGSAYLKKHKAQYIEAFHDLIKARLDLTETYASLYHNRLNLKDDTNGQQPNTKSLLMSNSFMIDCVKRDIEKTDRALDDYKFLLMDEDEEIASRELPKNVFTYEEIEKKVVDIFTKEIEKKKAIVSAKAAIPEECIDILLGYNKTNQELKRRNSEFEETENF